MAESTKIPEPAAPPPRRVNCGYLPGPRGGLHASLHLADRPVGGVLVLPPYGEERKCAYRLLVRLADELAAHGLLALRFDYSGTGESAGELAATSLSDWQADAAAAWAFLGERLGKPPTAVIGCRLGANLALGIGDPATTRHVLWEPLPTGNDYLEEMIRRKQVKEMMTVGKAASEAGDCRARWAAGEVVDFDGFPVSPAFAAELGENRLLETLTTTPRHNLFVCHITGAKRQYGVWADLEHLAGERGFVYKVLHEKPFWGRVDIYDAEELVRETVAFVV